MPILIDTADPASVALAALSNCARTATGADDLRARIAHLRSLAVDMAANGPEQTQQFYCEVVTHIDDTVSGG